MTHRLGASYFALALGLTLVATGGIGNFLSGTQIILGALAYISLKKRKFASNINSAIRRTFETLALLVSSIITIYQITAIGDFFENKYAGLAITPWSITTYLILWVRKPKQLVEREDAQPQTKDIPRMTSPTKKMLVPSFYLAALAFVCLYVPWKSETQIGFRGNQLTDTRSLGYSFIWEPPQAQAFTNVDIDLVRLLLETLAITFVFLITYFLTRTKGNGA